jgi:hypothetical protein
MDAIHLRLAATATKAKPTINSGGESHIIPKFATRFKFRTATTAAVTRKRIPTTRRVLADKFLPPFVNTLL